MFFSFQKRKENNAGETTHLGNRDVSRWNRKTSIRSLKISQFGYLKRVLAGFREKC